MVRQLRVHPAQRIRAALRRGSSWPVIVDTDAGRFVTKLRGAAQGILPLVAEIIVAELAEHLGLAVPERAVVALDSNVPSEDRNDELADLLERSRGLNLGVRWLNGATDLSAREACALDPAFRARVLWLDGLVMNPDRTAANPNILSWNGQPWLIDHGAALGFQHSLHTVSEASPREEGFATSHLFAADRDALLRIDAELTGRLSRQTLLDAASRIPDDFLCAVFPKDEPARIAHAYAAFLWKRLKAPRPFL